ncbi:hypothetical protein TIFTF001_008108 [Ficus carica]|uniref:Uncharacterized protein n=1 Tax=Ficus carica TaxID=3494 RepID=A0AA88D096_FICCA|nr:hypothetical protein TIFTF001_008108 [Ficus carica]
MYVTRPLSLLRRSPELLTLQPQDHHGPNSGYLVLFDEECETTTCFGLCKDMSIIGLPLPQNKDLTISHSSGVGETSTTDYDDALFIPVLDQPLSSNLYHVIRRQGNHIGEANASSREEDTRTCCFCTFINDVKPRPLDPLDIYQQFRIKDMKYHGFTAVSVAEDGFPPLFLRRKYWNVNMRPPRHYQLDEALGLNSSLLPVLNLSPSNSSSETMVVGKWYCPFVFVKERSAKLKEQMKRSMFYVVTLEQRWDKIFGFENGENSVRKFIYVDVLVERERACVDEDEAVCDWGHVDNGVIWFKSAQNGEEALRLLGLSVLVAERMRWEQERVGWRIDEIERKVRVKRTEEFEGKGEWRKFGCYVLAERFVFKRMNGSVLLTHDFKHISQIRCIWE